MNKMVLQGKETERWRRTLGNLSPILATHEKQDGTERCQAMVKAVIKRWNPYRKPIAARGAGCAQFVFGNVGAWDAHGMIRKSFWQKVSEAIMIAGQLCSQHDVGARSICKHHTLPQHNGGA